MYTLLWFGGGQSEPYSWTCIPKKQTSAPSMSSNANRAFNRYGKDSDISPVSTNLEEKKKCGLGKQVRVFPLQQELLSTRLHIDMRGVSMATTVLAQVWYSGCITSNRVHTVETRNQQWSSLYILRLSSWKGQLMARFLCHFTYSLQLSSQSEESR